MEFLESLEPVDSYTELQKVIFYTLMRKIHRSFGNLLKAYETAEKGMHYAKKIEQGIEIVDLILNNKTGISGSLEGYFLFFELLQFFNI